MTDWSRLALERSREVALFCEADGTIRWADDRAKRHLPLEIEAKPKLRHHAAPGSELLIDAFVGDARRREVIDRKVVMVLRDGPLPVRLSGEPHQDGVLVIATFGPRTELGVAMQLADANRAVLTLYDELAEKAAGLQRSAEVRSRVLSTVSHDFRMRLQSISGLTSLLLDRVDGPLTTEQDKQIRYIRAASASLSQQVEELLGLTTGESSELTLRVRSFTTAQLIAAVRGMVAPLPKSDAVTVTLADPPELELFTDEGKVAEILRHLIGNALKFTTRGEVRVTVRDAGDDVVFDVADTGIGIAEANQKQVFEEFSQVASAPKGTGLGLPVSRRLAMMLGGELTLGSELGKGSSFSLRIPKRHPESSEIARIEAGNQTVDPSRIPILVVEDDGQTLLAYERLLANGGFQLLAARRIDDARAILARVTPAAVVLDVMLEGETSWTLLSELKSNKATAAVPVIVITVTNREDKARQLGADAFFLKPIDEAALVKHLRDIAKPRPVGRVLMIDDDEVSLYLMRRLLDGSPYELIQAQGVAAGVAAASTIAPDMIFLDFILDHGHTAFDVLERLKTDTRTRDIPVVVVTSKDLSDDDRARLALQTKAVVAKQMLSREVAIRSIRETIAPAHPTG
jgi:signal transduction histidine kinase/CheY-like chemotaxis protein